jgi:ubiquinone/menaquinone biosynthesis C-methylase UbiE
MNGGQEIRSGAEFVGSVPAIYERLLVPMIFQAAAASLADAVAADSPRDILETAAGTGVLTRALLRTCPAASVTATDLNPPMLDVAKGQVPQAAAVSWKVADALDLPFDDESFDAVACQFGVMFFPDRVVGYREARRVLRPHGSFVFNVWDGIEHNEVPRIIESALNAAVATSHFAFMSSIPHGYSSLERIRSDLQEASLEAASIDAVSGTSASTPAEAAIAFCQGTPLRAEIESHPALDLVEATALAESALLRRFGEGPFEAPIRSFEVIARRAV